MCKFPGSARKVARSESYRTTRMEKQRTIERTAKYQETTVLSEKIGHQNAAGEVMLHQIISMTQGGYNTPMAHFINLDYSHIYASCYHV